MLYNIEYDSARQQWILSRLAPGGVEDRLYVAAGPERRPGGLRDGHDGFFYTIDRDERQTEFVLYRVPWPGPTAPRNFRVVR